MSMQEFRSKVFYFKDVIGNVIIEDIRPVNFFNIADYKYGDGQNDYFIQRFK